MKWRNEMEPANMSHFGRHSAVPHALGWSMNVILAFYPSAYVKKYCNGEMTGLKLPRFMLP
jgi:hypothetical protein